MRIPHWILPVFAGVMLGTIYFLPDPEEMAPSAINMELPRQLGEWQLNHKPASQEEILILAADTEFSKAVCLKAREGEYDPASGHAIPDRIDLSVVLSGHDLNNSIHRPERCMPSQGHVIGSSDDVMLKLPDGRSLKVKRLRSVQSIPLNEERTEFQNLDSLTYYFFVGNKETTNDHLHRTLLDMKDRLLLGMDQRWAYVSASMWYGDVPWIADEITFEEADRKLGEFVAKLADEQIDWGMMGE
jgi:hypothetical protein